MCELYKAAELKRALLDELRRSVWTHVCRLFDDVRGATSIFELHAWSANKDTIMRAKEFLSRVYKLTLEKRSFLPIYTNVKVLPQNQICGIASRYILVLCSSFITPKLRLRRVWLGESLLLLELTHVFC